jgi:hypothetical protein
VAVGLALVGLALVMGARRRGVRIGMLSLLAPLLVSACVSDTRPASCAEPSISIDLQLDGASLSPADPAVCRDQQVTLVVHSSVDGVLHIHGYDEQVDATSVTAGEDVRLEFTASRSGQFPIELHTDAAPQGTSVGVFTVHEP